ncbi:MFS transporter [Aliidongia dinghuensis]|uniref:MFS transporter n=1 Tax=Aliidongia dinghuensis TaxID=1867774 RepID=A0A8J3E4W7_9PROT|nr:MFS transporter [Aliidongia dinghuensis]
MILALIAIGTTINYLDRSVVGIAAPTMSRELGLNAALMGVIFSAFSWTYTASQIPAGILLDRFGTRTIYYAALTLWSLFTGLQCLATGFFSLLGLRLSMGVAEAPCFPTNSRVVAMWFPQHERARATGVYTFAEYIGLAFLTPLLFWIQAEFGWRMLFAIVGGAGIAYGFVWWSKYREPHAAKTVNQAELDYIEAGGGVVSGAKTSQRFEWSQIPYLLRQRAMAGICIGQFACNSTNVFFLTWFPTYLSQERHMEWLKVGWIAVLPFIAASVGTLVGGWISDALLRRGVSLNWARKGPVITGLLLASVIVTANYVRSDAVVIAILCVAYFAQGMSALAWMIVSDIAPKGLLGLSGGIFNLFANAAGIVTPLMIGLIVNATGSFVGALAFISVVTLTGALSYIFVVGDLKRIELN